MHDLTTREPSEAQLSQSQKMEALGRLAGGIAHDFNNLMAIIRVSTELLRDDTQPEAPEQEEIAAILAAIDRAAALTRQLLLFAGRQNNRPAALDLNAVIQSSERMLRPLLAGQVAFHITPAPALPHTMLDASEAEQVLVNLVVNARDAMPDGGTLTIETGTAPAFAAGDEAGASSAEYVVLTVRDTGVGVDEATKARMFEPFFTTKGPDGGTGLGLATVYGIVTRAGGHIECTSAPSLGTTFRICLPACVESPASAAPRAT